MRTTLLALALMAVLVRAAAADPIRVTGGSISGQEADGVSSYKGIPFAAPPTGDRRWKPPAPPVAWTGVRACTDFGPMCPQLPGPLSGTGPQSEDCLFLNVWAPAHARNLPVLVWFHGGGNMHGSDRFSYYNATALAKHNAIVVTAQYRLGIFGFFGHPALTEEAGHCGNYGLMDQIAALSWVKKNIRQFGGDPSRITAVGESSGASDIACLLTSPQTRHLLHGAIMESGHVYGDYPSRNELEDRGAKTAEELHVSDLAELRQVSAERLLGVSESYDDIDIDGQVIVQDPNKVWDAGQAQRIPIILGTTRDEGSADRTGPATVAEYQTQLKKIFGTLYDDALAAFPCKDDADAAPATVKIRTTLGFAAPARRQARIDQQHGVPAYRFLFSRVPPGPVGERLGAGHGTELAYVFGSFKHPLPAEVALSDRIETAYVQFAGTGHPGWPQAGRDGNTLLEFGDTVAVRNDWFVAQCNVADRLFER